MCLIHTHGSRFSLFVPTTSLSIYILWIFMLEFMSSFIPPVLSIVLQLSILSVFTSHFSATPLVPSQSLHVTGLAINVRSTGVLLLQSLPGQPQSRSGLVGTVQVMGSVDRTAVRTG